MIETLKTWTVSKKGSLWPSCAFALGALALGAVPLACGGKTSGDTLESNTNWLQECDADAECGDELACHCGVCTQTCEQDSCPARLECLAECGGAASCQAECSQDADCADLHADATCNDGVCGVEGEGLSTEVVSSEPPDEEGVCRVAYVEYPEGAKVPGDGCGQSTCTCQADGTLGECEGTDLVCELTGRVMDCAEMFPDLPAGEMPPSDQTFPVASAIDGNLLTLEVWHGGGCEEHDYALCFQGWDESYPVQVGLYLIHDAHGDECAALLQPSLRFDLSPLADAYREAYNSDGDIVQTTYGVYAFGELSCDARETGAARESARAYEAVSLECEQDEDCVWVSNDTGCHAACGTLMSVDSVDDYEAALGRIDSNLCADYEADCGPVLVPPCVPPGVPACVAGQCTEAF